MVPDVDIDIKVIKKATDKQMRVIKEIINHYGYDIIYGYISRYFNNVDINNLNVMQAQKIIGGEYGCRYMSLKRKPIRGIYGRDFHIIR